MANKKGRIGDRYRHVKFNHSSVKKKNRKEIKKIVFLVVILLTVTCGVSYSLLTLAVPGKEEVTIISGEFKINFKEGNTIKMGNAIPLTNEEGLKTDPYKFSIENTGDLDASYSISLEEGQITEDTLSKQKVKYSIKEDNSWSEPAILPDDLILISSKIMKVGEKKDYELKIWLDEASDNSTQGKKFEARIVVASVQNDVGNDTEIDSSNDDVLSD